LKARLCVEGRQRLYAFCERFRVPHKQVGKYVVAEAETPKLRAIYETAMKNGVSELTWMTRAEIEKGRAAVSYVAGSIRRARVSLTAERWRWRSAATLLVVTRFTLF